MDRLDAMQVMLTAVECGSLSKASRKVGQPLATVSRTVSELEGHPKANLLIRSSRGLELTPAGRTYLTSAKAILEQLHEAERAAAGESTEPKGDLVVTAPTMFGRATAADFLRRLVAAMPYRIHTVLTGNVTHFTTTGNTGSAAADIKAAIETANCSEHTRSSTVARSDIDHRLTKPKHPWTNGRVERMNRRLKDAILEQNPVSLDRSQRRRTYLRTHSV